MNKLIIGIIIVVGLWASVASTIYYKNTMNQGEKESLAVESGIDPNTIGAENYGDMTEKDVPKKEVSKPTTKSVKVEVPVLVDNKVDNTKQPEPTKTEVIEEENEEEVEPTFHYEVRYTLTLPKGSPLEEPEDKMTIEQLQKFTANLFSVYDSPYSKLLVASEDELMDFLKSNGYKVLRERIKYAD